MVLGGVTKNPLDESFDEFMEENHEFVEPGREHDAEEAAFEKHKKHAIENNADPNSKHTETVYPGLSELTDDEFKKTHLGLKGSQVEKMSEPRSLGLLPDPEMVRNDPVLKAEAEARMADLKSRGATPLNYNAVEDGKKCKHH